MYNAEKRRKRQIMIRPSSKVIIKFLIVMQKHGYIGEIEYVEDHRSGKIVVELNGRLNKCGVISLRFDVGVKDIEPWTAKLLPSGQYYHEPGTGNKFRSLASVKRYLMEIGYDDITTRGNMKLRMPRSKVKPLPIAFS
ncbi:hypothetical protein QQ045_013463 [Rhodiola kirilowii]